MSAPRDRLTTPLAGDGEPVPPLNGSGPDEPLGPALRVDDAAALVPSVPVSHVSRNFWPEALTEDAFHGIAGEFVRLVEPHTEADPAALLLQFLVAAGNAIGRGPHLLVGADRHGVNLSAVLVGATSRGRKGSSEGWVRAAVRVADERWADLRVQTGLSSGEGLIYAIRDKVMGVNKKGESVLVDPGEDDKRLLAIEPEFGRVLRVATREGNTLSAQLRLAWDAPRVMRTMTRTNPVKATEGHVSVIGHITVEELRRDLTSPDAANGFGNRLLWVCVRRSKFLPDGGDLSPHDLEPLGVRLRNIVEWASVQGRVTRDGGFKDEWRRIYADLSADFPGLYGAVTSRAEAQVLRLALLYALLDLSPVVGRRHLAAARAVWRYCAQSAAAVFGDSLGDPLADKILTAIVMSGDDGMTRTQIRDLAGHSRPTRTDSALKLLMSLGLVTKSDDPSTGGRRAERFSAGTRDRRDRRDQSPDFGPLRSHFGPIGEGGVT